MNVDFLFHQSKHGTKLESLFLNSGYTKAKIVAREGQGSKEQGQKCWAYE